MLWRELTKQALLGTENSSFSSNTLDALTGLGLDVNREAPVILADAASLLSQSRRAGFILNKFDGELPKPSASLGHRKVSVKSAHHLHLVLSGQHTAVLPEFLFLLNKTNKELPTSELPALMRMADLPQFWSQIEPLLGASGRWLLGQHPEWSTYLLDPKEFNWQTGTKTERLAQLTFWRKEYPNFAIELLSSTWEAENPNDKAAFLSKLEIGLSFDDEPFLEKCLNDRRKEVRLTAARLLAKLPSSKLAQRMTNRVENCFTFSNNSLKINVSESPDESAQQDGILPIHPSWLGGAKAGHLGQMVSLALPTHWESYFGKTSDEVLTLFSKSEWAETLIRACVEATVFHQDPTWAAELFKFWQKNEELSAWELPFVNHLSALIPEKEFNELAFSFLTETSTLPNESSPLFKLLKHNRTAWSDELSLMIINRFRMEIVKDYRQMWQLQHLSGYLQLLGLRCNPMLYDQLQKGWSNDSVQWRMWERPVEEMLARVLFRKEIREELLK